eukprot:Nitzschia sp. Nitz4//scaffold71_size96697//4727//10756//NITZ4_004685-RA/size96697-processed-gene-0.125-mRNA-1//-1//CDS//3329557217//475//frame0
MDDVNPIKSDPELQMLIRKLDRVNKYKTFQRWKDKFLAKLEDYLYEKGMQPAEKACDALEDRLKKLVMKTTKLLDYIHKGDLGEDKKTVKASLALNEMCNSLESARKEIEDLIPALKSEEKRRGYSKFHLGAALIRQGFHQYVSMKAVEDAVKEIGERLENVADKQQHELFHFYHVQVQRFCDVMADLSLYTVMMKCIQLSEAPDESESDEPEYIQIMVKTEDGKKLPMEVEETETVGNVKEATEAGTGIPADKQVMKFRGAILGNNAATMKELKVEDGAVFFLEPLRIPIVVRTPDGKEIPLTVDPNIYMTDLKRMLEPEAGIPAKNQQLSRNGQDLNDRSKTLDDYGIEAGAILDVEPKSIKVNIEMPDGEKVELEISPSDDAEAIKEKIAAKTGMPVPKQVLKHNGDEMPEGTTAKGLGVKEGDTIQVEVHKIPIKVNRWEGNEIAKVIELFVDPTVYVTELKRLLEPESGIPAKKQCLTKGGEELSDRSKTLEAYGIEAGSILDLEPVSITLSVEMPDGEKVEIEVLPSDTTDVIKDKIAAKTGMPIPKQVLKHNDAEMPPTATAKDQNLKEGSEIKVELFKIPIKVNQWDGKEISKVIELFVDPTVYITEVKRMLEPESGIPAKNQCLFKSGQELGDHNKSLKDYGIEAGAVLDLEPASMQVTVEMPDGEKISIEVLPSDTTDAIKDKIAAKTGMPIPKQVLKHNDAEMQPDATAKEQGLKEGSEIKVELFKIPITVKNWDGKEIELSVEPTETLENVKRMLEPETGIAPDNQMLRLGGEELAADRAPISDQGVVAGSVLDLEPKRINVNVEMPDGEKIPISVALADTADDVKERIAAKTGMEPKRQVVKHNDQELPGDGATVKDMGIKEGSDLKVDVFKIPVKVRNWDGTTTDLMVDPTEDLASVKKQLEPETGISPDNQRLFMDDKELVGDDKSAEDHGITPGAVLDLEPKSIKVSVDMPDGQSVEVDVAPSDDIDAIKKKIEEKTGMEAPRQVLKKGDDILPAGKTVKDMGIKEGDKLSVDINKIPVTVKNWDGSEFEILVEPTEGMASVKAKIEPESGIPADNQKVTHGGKDLDDNSKTVADCGIKKGDVLEVEPKIITVNVEMPDGETHAVSFPLLATPDDIKKAIEEKTGMSAPRQVVKHNGVELPKNSTAKKAGLKDGSTLQVEVYKIPVTVKNWDGTQMEVALEPTETLADLKKALEPESEIPADNQVLRKGDTELEGDDKPISDLGISPGTVLDLEPRSIALNVEMPDGEKVQIDVPLSDTKDDIKRKIAEKTGMDPIRQVVKHDDKELPGKGATVKDMGIKDGSDLAVEVFKIPVTVKSWDGKTADMMIDPTEALGAIKKQLEPEFDIPAENQSISMNGEKLADDAKTARDHGIKAGSILDLEPNSVKVAVTMPDGETVEVELSPSDDGAAIKKKIEDKTGMEVPRQVLKHDGVKVPNAGKNVGDLGLRDGSKLEVEILKVPITVKNWDGNNIEMMVEPTEKLADIKKRLEPESGIKVSNQVLSLDDNELSDNFKTATENGIKSGTVLELEPRTINVNAILPDGKSHRVEISPRDDTEGIKMKIEQQTGMEAPRQVLSFNGKKLPKRGTAKDMGIREDSDINVDIFKVPVIVNNWDGKRIEIMVDPLAKLSEMKKDLEPESGIKVSNQALFLGEQELTDDNKRAKAYGIEGGTVLDLEPRFIGISVEMPSGETISFEVKPSSTGDDIKGIVAEKTGVAAIRQVLHFGKKEVLADYTVKGMGIKNESTLKCELYKIPITVETKDGKTIPMKIEPIETLDGLKGLLEKDSGLPAKKQVISFIEKELEHGKKTMTEYGVKKGSVLFLEPKDDPIVFVDVKCGVLFGVDRDEVIEQGVLTMKGDSKLEFVETEAGSFAKEKMLKAMLDSPNLGVKPQIVVEKVEVEDYDLAEAENVKSKWGVQLKKTQKAKKGDEFIFVDVKTGAVGLLDRKKCIDMKFINLVGYGKDETLKEAEHTTKIRDKYVLQIRNIFGIKTAN